MNIEGLDIDLEPRTKFFRLQLGFELMWSLWTGSNLLFLRVLYQRLFLWLLFKLAMLFGTEWPAPLFLRHSFWGKCFGGLMSAVLFLAELSHGSQLMLRTLNICNIYFYYIRRIILFYESKLNKVTVLNLSFFS